MMMCVADTYAQEQRIDRRPGTAAEVHDVGFTNKCARTCFDMARSIIPTLDRFFAGDATDKEFREFAVEFYNFSRFFPRILAAQLVNTEDEAVADELTKVLYSELGDGTVKNRHERRAEKPGAARALLIWED